MDYVELARPAFGGLTTALGLSGDAHALALDVVLAQPTAQETSIAPMGITTGLVLAQLGRLQEISRDLRAWRWGGSAAGALGHGATPAVADLWLVLLAFAVALPLRWALIRAVGGAPAVSAMAGGVGLAAVGLALAALPAAGTRLHPRRWTGVLLGLAQGLSFFPGASVLGVGIVALSLAGVGRRRAVDLALLAALPHLVFDVFQGSAPPLPLWRSALAALGALLGALLLRRLADSDRLSWIGAWGAALGLALVAFGRSA